MAKEEYIRKEQIKRALRRLLNDEGSANEIFQAGFEHSIHLALEKIENISAADVAPVVHGHWIHPVGMNSRCSACGKYFPVKDFWNGPFSINYCPACGARMDEKDD